MYKSVLDYLEMNTKKYPEKPVFVQNRGGRKEEITYSQFVNSAKRVASSILEKQRIAIFIDKSINCLIAMCGINYSNSCYSIIDVQSPPDRVKNILSTFKPSLVLTDKKNFAKAQKFGFENIALLEDYVFRPINNEKLSSIQARMIDTDPMYVLFTSGSTGVPKGTVVCYRSVVDYAETVCRTFSINPETIWGSQTPFYFSMSILDVFTTIIAGATLNIIPKGKFSFPIELMEYLDENRINAIYWVPTALNMVANIDTFSEYKPKYLQKVLFAGEVMPVKPLNYWIKNLSGVLFANLYGPTEITDTCTYYIVNRKFEDSESLPIGIPFDNCDVLVIDDENHLINKSDEGQGELYVRGSFLGLGYYGNAEKTAAAFIQNPLNSAYPELLYRTGDLVEYNNYGELVYKGRKDHQIKHLGHRIELGEIEAVASSVEGIDAVCCLYEQEKQNIVLFYVGSISENDLSTLMHKALLSYMIPQRYLKLSALPINLNGKIDRIKLKENLKWIN